MSKEEILERGDIVRLRSGGPKMTVGGYAGKDFVEAIWFDDATGESGGVLRRDHFHTKALHVIVTEPVKLALNG